MNKGFLSGQHFFENVRGVAKTLTKIISCMSKYLIIPELEPNFNYTVIFMCSITVNYNFRSVYKIPPETLKINWRMFTRKAGRY